MVAELRAQFPFGVLLVTDDKSTDPIPGWSSEEQQVTSTATAMVMKIRHELMGPQPFAYGTKVHPATAVSKSTT